MADGGTFSSLRQRYVSALSGAESSLRALLGAPSSTWRPVQVSNTYKSPEDDVSRTAEASTSSTCVASRLEGPVILHRKKAKNAPDVIRAICHVPVTDDAAALESFRAVLQNTEIRPSWDSVTEREELLEIVEPGVTVSRSYSKVGWPGNPRDVVSVNKLLQDPSKTLIRLSVSLPRSSSSKSIDPPFLQPSPPYIRSHLHLCAFVITFPKAGVARVSMYWQWDLRSSGMIWGSHITAMPGILHELVRAASRRSSLLPYLRGWGREVALDSIRYETDADTLRLDYGIFSEQGQEDTERHGMYLEKSKERRRLERAWEVRLPTAESAASGWDITVDIPPLVGDQVEQTGWHCVAERSASDILSASRITFRVSHAKAQQEYIPVQVAVQRIAGSKTLRINGKTIPITDLEERDPAAHTAKSLVSPESLKLDVASITSVTTASSASSDVVAAPGETNGLSKRRPSQQTIYDALIAHNKRAYTGFLALLQSPAPKWKAVTEIKSVSISSYISIDTSSIPVYRFEATFVNTSIWDIFSVFVSSYARQIWDKASGLERFDLLGEVATVDPLASAIESPEATSAAGEGLTSFHTASWRGSWPVLPREATLLRTAYKSPTTVHVFYTSVPDESDIAKHVPANLQPRQPNSIMSQIHLQAIAIDQISPTTTTLTLVDQHDPKGWSKSSYSTMAAAVAGIGEYALRTGAPPVITQLSNAKNVVPYKKDTQDQSHFAYKAIMPTERTECMLRCDNQIWSASGVSIDVQPPPMRVSALIRHSLSERGPGCWITIEHEPLPSDEEEQPQEVKLAVSRGSADARDRNGVWINGARLNVEVEELGEEALKELRSKKRIRGTAYLLDQPGSVRQGLHRSRPSSVFGKEAPFAAQVVASLPLVIPKPPSPAPVREPMEHALSALATLQNIYTEQTQPDLTRDLDNWTILSYAENNSPIRISKRMLPQLSAITPLYRVDRTFPTGEAQHVMRLISSLSTSTRSLWDDRILTVEPVCQYGNGCSTSVWFTKPIFPMRGRFAYTANVRAEMLVPAPPGSASATSTVYMYASASIPLDQLRQQTDNRIPLNIDALNPSRTTEAKILLEGWIIEGHTSPSSVVNDDDGDDIETERVRCSYFTCSDLPGVGSGPFGIASIRYRLSSLFDSLERVLSKPSFYPTLVLPVNALQIEGSLQKHSDQNESWRITSASEYTEVISSSGNSVILVVSSPKTKIAAPVSEQPEARSKRLSFPGTYQKTGFTSKDTQPALPSSSPPPAPRPGPPKQTASTASLTNVQKEVRESSNDTIVLEMVIQRDSATAGYDIKTTISMLDVDRSVMPSDTTYWHHTSSVPFKLSVIPLSLPSSTCTRFLLQLALPTAQLVEPLDHPLSSLTSAPSLPKWYKKLTEGKAILQVQLVPYKVESRVEGRPLPALRASLNGNNVAIAGEAEIKARIQSLDDDESRPAASKISRIPTDGNASTLPLQLSQPRVINSAYMVAKAKPPADNRNGPLPSPAQDSPKLTAAERRVGSESTVTAAVASIEKATLPLVDMFTATIPHGSATPGGKAMLERTYRLPFVILVAVLAFLVGSLLRSFLSPMDYVFFSRAVGGVESAFLELLDPKRTWKYAFRLLHVKIPFFGHDLVAALVEKE